MGHAADEVLLLLPDPGAGRVIAIRVAGVVAVVRRREQGAGRLFDRAHAMPEENRDASGLDHLGEDRPILRIVKVLLQDRPSRAADSFFATPVDMHQAAITPLAFPP